MLPLLRVLSSALLLLAYGGCATAPVARAVPEKPSPELTPGPKVLEFQGACDASGAVPLDNWLFAVGDDEDNVLRIYDATRGGQPVLEHDVSESLQIERGKKRFPEADVEAATNLGSRSYWLTSHGLNSSGKREESRFLFFATELNRATHEMTLRGTPYRSLLDDLLALESLRGFGLENAAKIPPKLPGGLNIEGMTSLNGGNGMLVGFRSPLSGNKAITITLLNPEEVIEGGRAEFGPPRLLDLQGQGIRSISSWRGEYLLIAGSPASGGVSRLFTWQGGDDEPVLVDDADFSGLNPEAFVTPEDRDEILILSDDGTRLIDGKECKKQKDPAKKRFRGIWVRLPPPGAPTP